MSQAKKGVKTLLFHSNNIASILLCSVLFSFIHTEAKIHSRCALQDLPQGHRQAEVLGMTSADLKVLWRRESPFPADPIELELSLWMKIELCLLKSRPFNFSGLSLIIWFNSYWVCGRQASVQTTSTPTMVSSHQN